MSAAKATRGASMAMRMTPEKWVALFTAGCFMVLASYACGTSAPRPRAARFAITAEVDMEPHHESGGRSERAAVVKLWKRLGHSATSKASALARKQAEAYVAVYGITPDNMNSYREWW